MKKWIILTAVIIIVVIITALLYVSRPEEEIPPKVTFCDQETDWEACFEKQYQTAATQRIFSFNQEKELPPKALKRHIRINLTLQNLENQPVENLDLWIYLPLKNFPGQTLTKAKLSLPAKLTTDSFGHRIMKLELKSIAPYETRVVGILASLVLSENGSETEEDPIEKYLEPERLIQMDDQEIKKAAVGLKGKSDLETAKKTYKYVVRTVKSHGYDGQDRGALKALQSRKGDCTEMALLFTALSRANGLPARTITGFRVKRDKLVHQSELHNWAQFYIQGKWRLADPFYAVFDSSSNQYIALEIFRGRHFNPVKNYHVFRFKADNARFKVSY